ncbi:endolysin [Arthrobacter phage Sarge]|uniref:N-acetylmuramoyl-L-alanine amidase n=1 Tax=Arthrobacter phage Sarge TaxID=2885974 RepID=A0AAE8Y861_9CAUD|nr:endolysin [Arthrobacter phage Sarge]UDL14869.1 endolysin [Arthrobacter phage Sarge]
MTNINENLTAKGFTRAADVPAIFGRPRTLDGIVIHHWGLPGQTHDGVVDFFVNGPGTTSAHFVVSEGRIHCLVSPEDAAWHSGNAVGNATTIGIECRPEATPGDYLTVAELVRWLRDQYGPLPLSPHRQWQSTACPGVWDLNRINALANAATITPQSTSSTSKGIFMALTRAQELEVLEAARKINRYLDAPVSKVDEAVLDAPIVRAGVGGNTSLRATLAHLDKNLNTLRDALKAAVTKP